MNMIDALGEDETKSILSSFSCPQAPDVESFIRSKAILFAVQGWAQTHIVVTSYRKNPVVVGYFTLANMVITIRTKALSKTTQKRIAKFAVYDNDLKAA